jgi:bifunctional non-homologous end joining protein LigD
MKEIILQQPADYEVAFATPEPLFSNDDFCAQEKFDGVRCVIFCERGELHAEHRSGRGLALPAKVRALMPLGDWILDGELVGEDFTAFDIITLDGEDLRALPYDERLAKLVTLKVPMIETAYGEAAKRRLHVAVYSKGGEGIVFKRTDTAYRPGKTSAQLKLKNWKSETFRVRSADGRGVELETLDGKPAGRCAGYADAGKLVEVRFQEVTEAGKLRSPVMLGVRDDLE